MVVKINTDGSNPQQPQQTVTGGAPTIDVNAGNAAPGLKDQLTQNLSGLGFYAEFGLAQSTPDIDKYIENTLETANKSAMGGKSPVEITSTKLLDPAGGYAFMATSKDNVTFASIVIFSEIAQLSSTMTGDYTPVSRLTVQAQKSLTERYPNIRVVNVYVITNDDLQNYQQMANCLRMDLIPFADGASKVNLKELTANLDFVIEINTEKAISIIKRMSPHKVQPRINFGGVISIKEKGQQTTQLGNSERLVESPKAFLAFGGYTEVFGPYRDPQTGRPRYLPLFKITDITAIAPVMGSVLLTGLNCVQLIAQQGLWINQFNTFGKGEPNLGSIFVQPNGQRWRAENRNDLEEFVAVNFQRPAIALSIAEGRRRIPTLAMFEDLDSYNNDILRATGRFFGLDPNTALPGINAGQLLTVDYIGTYGSGDNKRDTREMSYLSMVAQGLSLEPNEARAMLMMSTDPKPRASVIHRYTTDFQPLYQESTVALSASYLNWVSTLKGNQITIIDKTGQTGTMSMMGISDQFTDFSQFQPIINGAGNNGNSGPVGVFNLGNLW